MKFRFDFSVSPWIILEFMDNDYFNIFLLKSNKLYLYVLIISKLRNLELVKKIELITCHYNYNDNLKP
jgi:hypothetical protein